MFNYAKKNSYKFYIREMLYVTDFLSLFYITSYMNIHNWFIYLQIIITQLMTTNKILSCNAVIQNSEKKVIYRNHCILFIHLPFVCAS